MVEGDFYQPETFGRALAGVDRLFLLIPSSAEVEAQQRGFVDAAKRAGVRHIVKLSQLGADVHSTGRFQRYHGAVEDYIRNSGIELTFLRLNLFMQGLLNFRSVIAKAPGAFARFAQDTPRNSARTRLEPRLNRRKRPIVRSSADIEHAGVGGDVEIANEATHPARAKSSEGPVKDAHPHSG